MSYPLLILWSLAGQTALLPPAAILPGFHLSPWFGEQVREEWIVDGVRVLVNAPESFDHRKPTRLVIFATPNGNTIEQTLGCANGKGLDWHFDIQHIAAQARKLRALLPEENVVFACTEADTLSWPAWKAKQRDGPAQVRKVVDIIKSWVPADNLRLMLAGHSGGGSFLFGYIDSGPEIPAEVERIVFLDANYSYNDADKHGDKLIAWLKGDKRRRLVVIAYDDREITLNGKRVVGPAGGTYRATERMQARFAQDTPLAESRMADFIQRVGLNGQVAFHVHTNPANKILHTALVGEMNGLLFSLTDPESPPAWGTFGGPRAYTEWVQPAPGIPSRPADVLDGAAFFQKINSLRAKGGMSAPAYEEAVAAEILKGNIPDFLRTFQKVTIQGKDPGGKARTVVIEVMPDYLAVGSDTDFVRTPLMPTTAARIAEAFGCALPTRKIVDEVHQAATVKLEPRPMTRDRELAATFLAHNQIIEGQRAGQKLGELVVGIKKDVVVTNRLGERPNRVAIYGWHRLDGKPIQPLTTVHVNWYVDYSHGIRLMKRTVLVDGKPWDVRAVLYSADLAPFLSDEGPVKNSTY